MPANRTAGTGGRPTNSLPKVTIRKIQKILLDWGKDNYKAFPWRDAAQPWQGLIAEILLQRTKAQNVIPVYQRFLNEFKTPENLAEAPVAQIEAIIFPLGLRWRAPLLKKLGEYLLETGLQLPLNLEQLLKLPGVGAYVAGAWLSFYGGVRSVIVDANVVRLLCRLTGQPMDGETRRKKWLLELADQFTPTEEWKVFNYALLDFTMEICTVRPKCAQCPIGPKLCVYGRQYLQVVEKRLRSDTLEE